jgi:hypothetical protein
MVTTDPIPNPDAARESLSQSLAQTGLKNFPLIITVLLDFPDEAGRIIAEQKRAVEEWGKHGENVQEQITLRLPDQFGEIRGEVLTNTNRYCTPLLNVMKTINSLRGDRRPDECINIRGSSYLIDEEQPAGKVTEMIARLKEVMNISKEDIVLLEAYNEACLTVDEINTRIKELKDRRDDLQDELINWTNMRPDAKTEHRLKIGNLNAEIAGLRIRASHLMENTMHVINEKYPPKKEKATT